MAEGLPHAPEQALSCLRATGAKKSINWIFLTGESAWPAITRFFFGTKSIIFFSSQFWLIFIGGSIVSHSIQKHCLFFFFSPVVVCFFYQGRCCSTQLFCAPCTQTHPPKWKLAIRAFSRSICIFLSYCVLAQWQWFVCRLLMIKQCQISVMS